MTPERWRQISEIFYAARLRGPAEQAAYVAAACADDDALCRDVSVLLQAHNEGAGFGSSPLMLSSRQLQSGTLFGAYRIEALLGRGGMGEVYRARDTKLNRDVALKILPDVFSFDPGRVARFKREAQLLALLNHPNIAAIFGVEENEDRQALVLELVEGSTLAERLARRPIPLNEAVPIAKQIADALEAAHERGVVHRDLKPANVKVRPDGTVKVLDFGLAKALDSHIGAKDPSDSSAEFTHRGVIIGTAAYMSPEQARGQPTDQRTDVWAFGCLLFEMLCGRPAFKRSTIADTLAAVVDREPDWNSLPRLPPTLDRLLKKCLAKDTRRRLRNLGDAALDLDDAYIVSAPKEVLTRWVAIAAAAILSLVVSALWIRTNTASSPATEIVQPAFVTTYPGSERSPSFSPDGSQFVFVWDGENQNILDIWVKRVGSGPPLQLTKDPNEEDNPVWKPQGDLVAFLRRKSITMQVLVMPPLGGPEQVVVEDDQIVWRTLDWSPDGAWLVYGRRSNREPPGLWAQSLESGERHRLTTATVSNEFDTEARFSPSGRSLAFVRQLSTSAPKVYVLALDDKMRPIGDPRLMTTDGLNHGSPIWLANGAELMFSTGARGVSSLERMPASGGRARRVMAVNTEGGIAFSQTTNRLLISASTTELDIDRAELSPDGAQALSVRPVIASSRYDAHPVFSLNGEKVAFASTRSGEWQIWACDSNGANPVQLTNLKLPGGEVLPTSWKPADGRKIGFVYNGDGTSRAYMVDVTGGVPQRVPELANVKSNLFRFWWSRNGSWIVYITSDGVWKIPSGRGSPVKLGSYGGQPGFDGNSAVVTVYGGTYGTSSVPLDGGAVRPITSPMMSRFEGFSFGFTGSYGPEGQYLLKGPIFSNFTTIPRELMFSRFSSGEILRVGVDAVSPFGVSLSPNGRSLLYTRFVSSGSDLMLVENFK